MTDADFLLWLKDEAARPCVLVEAVARVGVFETTRYMSTMGYVTSPTDSPANTHYDSIIVGGCETTEELNVDGSPVMTFSDIEIDNTEGIRASWLNDIWANRAIAIYVGDMDWPRSDFRLVFAGTIKDIDESSRDTLSLKINDKLQQLNCSVTEVALGGTSIYKDRLLPLTFGEVHNISPLLVDKATLKYMVHNGPVEAIIEVRDNGTPVGFTADVATGTFTLTAEPFGTITCSVQGAKPSTYTNTVAGIIKLLTTSYGSHPLTLGEFDSSWATFDAANPQAVGVYLTDTANVWEVCQGLAASIGSQVTMTPLGKLKLIKIGLTGTAGTSVNEDDMDAQSCQIGARYDVQPAVRVAYCKNWTVQSDLATNIPAEHKQLFALEWLTATQSDPSIAGTYYKDISPQQEETYLLDTTEANAEASRRCTLWKTQRETIRYDGMRWLLLEQIGDFQTLSNDFAGLTNKNGQTLKVRRSWYNMDVSFEVLT